MGRRREGREAALQMLYQIEISGQSADECADTYWTTRKGKQIPTIRRVPFQGDLDDAEQTALRDPDTRFEFAATAALDGDRLVTGRPALLHDVTIPLKTIFVHRAGMDRDATLCDMPGGRELLAACSRPANPLRAPKEDAALEYHFRLLWRMAQRQADKTEDGLAIKQLVLTHPNYLCPKEASDDIEKYTTYYRNLIRPICGSGVQLHWASEGQPAACKNRHTPSHAW